MVDVVVPGGSGNPAPSPNTPGVAARDLSNVLNADMLAKGLEAGLAASGSYVPTTALLTSFAALSPLSVDFMIYSTGTDTLGATAAPAYGRSLIGQANANNARTVLGLSSSATKVTGTTAGTLAAGDDTRIVNALEKGNNLSDVSNAATARSNLGLGSIATQAANNVTITGGIITGIADLTVADGGTGASTATNARTNLGVAIGSDVQPWDADLDAVAALTTPATSITNSVQKTGSTMNASAVLRVDAGTSALPGLAVGEATTGFYLASAGVLQLRSSVDVAGSDYLQYATGQLTITKTGAGATLVINSETGFAGVTINKYSNDAVGASNDFRKARGTIAVPSAVVLSDVLGSISFRAYTGLGFTQAAVIDAYVTETGTISATVIGTGLRFRGTVIGGTGLTVLGAWTPDQGISIGSTASTNIVIDQNRIIRPRSYTVATVPTATATGLISVSDEGGASAQVRSDGTTWRRTDDGQVVTAAIGARGVLGSLSVRANETLRELVRGVFYRLDKYSLTAKLKGLWVHAMPNQTDALLNWITPGTRNLTIAGSLTFTASRGFTGDGSTGYLNTGAAAAIFGCAQDSFSIGGYVLTASAAAATILGCVASTRRLYLPSQTAGAFAGVKCNDSTSDSYTPARYVGMFTLNRAAGATYKAYLDDAISATITRASTALQTGSLSFIGTTDTTASEFSTAQMAFSFVGTALTDADVAHLRAIMVDYFLVGVGAVNPTVANLPPATDFQGTAIYFSNLGGGAGSLRSNGTNWQRSDTLGYEAQGDADKTLVVFTNAEYQNFTIAGINRTITLSTTNAYTGAKFVIKRSDTGAGTLAIVNGGPGAGTLYTIPTVTKASAEVVFNGTDWVLMRNGLIL